MKSHPYLLLGLLWGLVWPTVAAAAETPLIWRACAAEAAANHPDLTARREALRAARAGITAARGSLLPQLSASAGVNWSREGDYPAGRSLDYGLTAQQLLFDGLRTYRQMEKAELARESAELDYADASADVRQRLRQAFVELQRAQAAESLTRNILRRRQQNLELVRLRYEAGREHRGSLLLAQAQLAQAKAGVSQAQRDLLQAQIELNRELGRPLFDPVTAEPDWDMPGTEEKPDFAAAIRKHAQWRALGARTESARLGALAAQGSWFPGFSANASARRAGSELPLTQNSLSAGLDLSWTLFNGGRRWGETEQAQAEHAQAQALEAAGHETLLANGVNAWSSYQDSAEAVMVQRQFLAAADERSKISEAEYSTGLLGFDNWTIIEDDYVSVQKAFLNAQAQSLKDQAGWVRATGGTLEHEF